MRFNIFLLCFSLYSLVGCKQGLDQQISALEQKLATAYTPETAQKLVGTYQEAVKLDPENPNNYDYLLKGSTLLWDKNRISEAPAKMTCQAINQYGMGKNLSSAVGLLSQLYLDMRLKIGTDKPESDLLLETKKTLLTHQAALDSALQIKRNEMVDAEQKLVKPEVVPVLTDMIEAYALALGTVNQVKTAELLFEAANANRAIGNFARAIGFYQQVADNQADLQKAANSQFMMAFVYENDMQALPQAKAAYETFLKRFPQNEMARDAQVALANLGKSPEQLLKEFNKTKPN
jgi:tetratricopeptide (TPR) repeat protein